MKEYPRLLVLSNNSFSKSNSNGRTLGSLLQGWPKDKIAQFCISTDGPDFEVCDNYYCITDADVLCATLKFRSAQRRKLEEAIKINANADASGKKKHRKTAFKMLVRNIAWDLGLWQGKCFWEWVMDFNPDVVLVQSGDSFFMLNLACKIQKKTGAKLAVFNTEAAFLFKGDYFRSDASVFEKCIFPIYRLIYNRSFKRFMAKVFSAIYGNTLLLEDYEKALGSTSKSCVIYTSSDISADCKDFNPHNPRFSYLGNMGFMRPKALAQVGAVLQKISKDYYLDVYGEPQTEENEIILRTSPGIRFHGLVDYSKVKEVITHSDLLFHVEYDSPITAESLRYGFSTKIADSIKSQRIFVLFAPETIACSQYINQTGAGIYASNISSLEKQLRKIIKDSDYRKSVLSRAATIAAKNHNSTANVAKMLKALTL